MSEDLRQRELVPRGSDGNYCYGKKKSSSTKTCGSFFFEYKILCVRATGGSGSCMHNVSEFCNCLR
jgi:hypothetical protein